MKETPRYVEGELLVKYKGSVPAAARALSIGTLGARRLREFVDIGVEHVRLPAGMTMEEGLSAFRANPDVEYAEPNYIVKAEAVPDDPRYLSGELWGLDIINAPAGWDITNGVSSVVVAVVDTGVDYNHPDLAANIWNNPGEICDNDQDDDGNGYFDDCRGWDFTDNDKDPSDPDGHGTHVAGTIGAVGNNGVGVTGVNWRVSIMPLRFLDSSGLGDTAHAIAAINYARKNNANVVNCSWGGYNFSLSLKAAVDASPGVLFVCAAGNDSLDTEIHPHYPSSFGSANVISVGASDSADGLAHFSNYGLTSVDVAAPGVEILSTVPARKTIWSDNFDDASLSPWTTGGTNMWGLQSGVYNSPNYSLSDSPSSNYENNADSWAEAPELSLAGETACKLSYEINYDLESGYDFLCVEASSDNSSFSIIGGGCFTGFSSGWEHWDDDLSDFEDKPAVYVRFRLTSDSFVRHPGVNIDDVSITCSSSVYGGAEYEELSGTSMAAPHVAGIAALMIANSPSPPLPKVMKHLIHFSVDKRPSMAGKVGAGGRANAFGALTTGLADLPPFAPSDLRATPGTVAVLGWTDNSPDEEGFVLERRTGDSGAFAAFPPLPANATSYTDAGLSIGVKYYYRVKAWNSTGDSPYSRAALSYVPPPTRGGGGGMGCFIATAAYGSPMAPEVELLRRFRDKRLMGSAPGRFLVRLYYRLSPPLADFIREKPPLRLAARMLLAPVALGVKHPGGALVLCIFTATAALVKLVTIGNRRNKTKRRGQ